MPAPFDSLANSDAFEELCFDILQAEGFLGLTWRGPGADGGRDIEATWRVVDPTGSPWATRWYVECKWYTDSVPFAEIEPKLLAAQAARADYLLVMTSSRVRNTAMDMATTWLERRGFPFQLRYWTGRDLLRLSARHREVFEKHFPGATAPTSSDADASLQRLRLLFGSSTDRLSWRITSALQAIGGNLAVGAPSAKTATAQRHLDFVLCMLRGHEALLPNLPKPAELGDHRVTCPLRRCAATVRRR